MNIFLNFGDHKQVNIVKMCVDHSKNVHNLSRFTKNVHRITSKE